MHGRKLYLLAAVLARGTKSKRYKYCKVSNLAHTLTQAHTDLKKKHTDI